MLIFLLLYTNLSFLLLLLFMIFSFSVVSNHLTIIWPGMVFFVFILPGFHWPSWTINLNFSSYLKLLETLIFSKFSFCIPLPQNPITFSLCFNLYNFYCFIVLYSHLPMLSSAVTYLLLSLFIQVFNSEKCTFQFCKPHLVLYFNFYSLLFVFMFFCDSLNILVIVVLKTLCAKSIIYGSLSI